MRLNSNVKNFDEIGKKLGMSGEKASKLFYHALTKLSSPKFKKDFENIFETMKMIERLDKSGL